MGHYLLSVWHDEEYELDFASDDAQRRIAQVGAFNAELEAAGVLQYAGGLQPASSATVMRAGDDGVSVREGPYVSVPQQMGGFWIIEAADPASADQWARKAAAACEQAVELRPLQGG